MKPGKRVVRDEVDTNGKEVEDEDEDEDDDEIGPTLPTAPAPDVPRRKRRKKLVNTTVFQQNLPQLERYTRSFMHREALCAIDVTAQTHFLITSSIDGVVKFWKKRPSGIEFVKQYRAHVGAITATSASTDGLLYATACASEKTIKAFDVINFDLITMLQLDYEPRSICWVGRTGQGAALLAVSDANSPTVRIYNLKGDLDPIETIKNVHSQPVHLMAYNPRYHCVVSCDIIGHVEYWTPEGDFARPASLFEAKSGTDLYEFRKQKSVPSCITMSPEFDSFATLSFPDRQVRLFRFKTGKIVRKYDESLATIEEMRQTGTLMVQLDDIEFGKRLAVEREIERDTSAVSASNVIFDESGHFIMYATMLGIKVIDTTSNSCVKIYGREERFRPLNIALYQGAPSKQRTTTLAMAASSNPLITESLQRDPILFATSYHRHRFYLFASHADSTDDRDVINELPTAEELQATAQQKEAAKGETVSGTRATLHTSTGDIHVTLYPFKTPKTVENFTTLARKGYYDGTIFHRTIRQFMIQGGDPDGNGTGGESMWGGHFEDEIVPDLKHDKYVLSMANAGPNTNGSQFFVTTAETHHLNGKHTIFGRVTQGFDVVHMIENAPVGKLDRPRNPVHIHSIDVQK